MKMFKMFVVVFMVMFFFTSLGFAECPVFDKNVYPFDPSEHAIEEINKRLKMKPSNFVDLDDGYYVIWEKKNAYAYLIHVNTNERVDQMGVTVPYDIDKPKLMKNDIKKTITTLINGGAILVERQSTPDEANIVFRCDEAVHTINVQKEEDGKFYLTVVVTWHKD